MDAAEATVAIVAATVVVFVADTRDVRLLTSLKQHRITENLAEHRAVEAWRRAGGDVRRVQAVEVLKDKKPKKSRVYRLIGVGPDGAPVIAKRCRTESAAVERAMYEHVLPGVPVPRLRCYGSTPDLAPQQQWIFLEDAGDARIGENRLDEVISWLARFHLNAAEAARSVSAELPDRGLACHRGNMDSAQRALQAALEVPEFTSDDRRLLTALIGLLGDVEHRWPRLEGMYRSSPTTLIHGDFQQKNVRVREEGCDPGLRVIDWEWAGWGMPGYDLASLAREHAELPDRETLEEYLAIVRPVWGCDLHDVRSMACVGLILRCIERIVVNSRSISRGPENWLMDRMRVVESRLRGVIGEIEDS